MIGMPQRFLDTRSVMHDPALNGAVIHDRAAASTHIRTAGCIFILYTSTLTV